MQLCLMKLVLPLMIVICMKFLIGVETKFIKNKLVQNSKVYCELETYKDESLTELMECYYNANFSGCELDDLNIKTGRVGLRPIDHGLFISTETSKVILSNILSKEDLKFPLNPFQLTEKKLKKLYRLFLVDRNDNDSLPYIIIGFKPKDTTMIFLLVKF